MYAEDIGGGVYPAQARGSKLHVFCAAPDFCTQGLLRLPRQPPPQTDIRPLEKKLLVKTWTTQLLSSNPFSTIKDENHARLVEVPWVAWVLIWCPDMLVAFRFSQETDPARTSLCAWAQ